MKYTFRRFTRLKHRISELTPRPVLHKTTRLTPPFFKTLILLLIKEFIQEDSSCDKIVLHIFKIRN